MAFLLFQGENFVGHCLPRPSNHFDRVDTGSGLGRYFSQQCPGRQAHRQNCKGNAGKVTWCKAMIVFTKI